MFSVQTWFSKLKAVAHVADVFMDQLAYEVTRQKVESHHRVRDFFVPSKNNILNRFKAANKIKTIHKSFDKIFKWAADLGLQPIAQLSATVQVREIRHTAPFEVETQVVGRDEDVSNLVHVLSKIHDEDLLVVAVAGMGGQGKTTLARVVYNKDVVINIFSRRIWVTISDDFDFMKILNQMGVKVLLVLDDVWNEKADKWDSLMNSLLGVGCAKGSSILVTTRNQEVIDAMQCSVCYRVEKLSEEYSWALFKQRAFTHGGVLETREFVDLGRRMVERCGGLPLAIKTLGGLLYSKKSEEEWLLILNSEVWKSKGVLSSLRLSYDNLPYSSLKRCFAYFSVLSKDSLIYKDEMVHICMALGFLLSPGDTNLLMEDVGSEYFNILLSNSLLQDVETDEYGNITCCKMHDLAVDVSTNHSQTVTPSQDSNQLSQAIHVRLEGFEDLKPNIYKAYFYTVQSLYSQASIFSVLLPNLKHLRGRLVQASVISGMSFVHSKPISG
ncbi:putative disease resistance protein RGA3 [Daucus carota subsp. sativus]|uniref:putative disease resistance protein RGA3 n=1 Tax=Daucus carota subsp. sativus TaxID=79200 RepID=UPI003082823F